jgi:chemotaxis protein MotB
MSGASLFKRPLPTTNTHKSQGLSRWVIPYADLLTVLFVVLLATQLPQNDTNKANEGKTSSPPLRNQQVAQANAPTQALAMAQPIPQLKSTTPLTITPTLAAQLKRLGISHHINPKGQMAITLPQQVLFKANAFGLTPQGQQVLTKMAPLLQQAPGRIQIEGHTDNQPCKGNLVKASGEKASWSNWQLSALRAGSVADVLNRKLGIDARQISALGRADSQPIKANTTPAGQAANRRVVITLDPPL